MPTQLGKSILNRWTPSTPVRADFGGWIAYLSIDTAMVRAAVATRDGVIQARAQLIAGATIEQRDGGTYRIVSRSGE
jgi:hypothetical protein